MIPFLMTLLRAALPSTSLLKRPCTLTLAKDGGQLHSSGGAACDHVGRVWSLFSRRWLSTDEPLAKGKCCVTLLISRQHVVFVPPHLVRICNLEWHGTQSSVLDYMALSLVY